MRFGTTTAAALIASGAGWLTARILRHRRGGAETSEAAIGEQPPPFAETMPGEEIRESQPYPEPSPRPEEPPRH